jgi:hypothetical protein
MAGKLDKKASRDVIWVDFDGTLHKDDKGPLDLTAYDPPKPGAADAVSALNQQYDLIICTARTDLKNVRRWLEKYGLDEYFIGVTNTKPKSVAGLDDKVFNFTDWPTALRVLQDFLGVDLGVENATGGAS